VILVRHAEKVDSSADLTCPPPGGSGRTISRPRSRPFRSRPSSFSEYKRTLQTAEPVARALHLTPVAIAVSGKASSQATETAAAIKKLAPGTAALVVGHSNTIGLIIEALGGPHLGDLCDGEYASIFVLELAPGAAPKLLHASFGAPDAPQAVACHHNMRVN